MNLPYIFNLSNKEVAFKIRIANNPKIEEHINHFEVRVETNNESFVKFIFYFKLFYFVISAFMFRKYHKKLSLQLKTSILLEQKIIYALGIMLILYNTPFVFYFTEIKPHLYLIEIFCLVNIVFFSTILYFWLVSFEIAFSKRGDFKVFQPIWKIVLYILMMLYGFIVYVDESLQFLNDPTSIHHHYYYKSWVSYCQKIYIVCCIVSLLIIAKYIFEIQVNFLFNSA